MKDSIRSFLTQAKRYATVLSTIRIRIWRYPNSGGFGVNIFRDDVRVFAIDWHEYKPSGQGIRKLHFHRGKTKAQLKKHRPWQGGW